MATNTSLLDLPIDIILLLFPYLDALSFLRLTSTCKALHKPDFTNDAQYWSALVRTTFRVPNQPVVQHDGKRWQKLYKRLLTQSKIYTWGNNEKACLGHSYESPAALQAIGPPGLRRFNALRRRHISSPGEMQGTRDLGVVSDLQCGGWSTTLLNSKGALYTVGVIDGLQFNQTRPPYTQRVFMEPTLLRYPSGFASPLQRHEPATAIKQFSAGRSHVLALSDSGRIWSWQNIEHAALHVKFLLHETKEDGRDSGKGAVRKVVAGWNKSAALVEGTGIVVWEPLQRGHDDNEIEDTALVMQSVVVPKTDYRRTSVKAGSAGADYDATLAESVGEILNFVVLEQVVLFNTHLGKTFAAQIFWNNGDQRVAEPTNSVRRIAEPIELQLTNSEEDDTLFATDVQGSFRSFAVFTASGAVLTSNLDRLMDHLQNIPLQQPLFKRIPALQNKDVISIAFGDYHFHALHSSGYITSYGNEPQACGALGLGGHGDPEGRLRGIRYQGLGGDGRLVPHAYTEGRRVWFEQEKHTWIKFLTAGGAQPEEAAERIRMALGQPDVRCQGEVSEWVEQQGRDWEGKFGVKGEKDDGLGAYFALSVTAAGWHSGALVLVNEELARKVRRACEIPDPEAQEGEEEKVDEEPHEEPPMQSPSSLLAWLLSTSLDYGRWFLGIGPYTAASPPPNHQNRNVAQPPEGYTGANAQMGDFVRVIHKRNFGESPREGVKYAWANDHFPRLRLSDETEMPGSVEFDEWRYGRPEFDLDAGV